MRSIQIATVVVLYTLLAACASTRENVEDKSERSSKINVELGITYMKEGKYNTAMDRLQKAIRQDPANAQAYSSMALLNMRLKQIDEAESNFTKALKITPDDSAIRNNYGAFLCQRERFEDAERQFMLAVKDPLYQTPEHAYLNAGKCTRNKVKAEKYFRAALRANPVLPGALLEMARLNLDLKRYLSARAYLQRYHAVHEPDAASLWISVQVENQLGDENTRDSHALLLKRKFPDSEETRLYLQWKKE